MKSFWSPWGTWKCIGVNIGKMLAEENTTLTSETFAVNGYIFKYSNHWSLAKSQLSAERAAFRQIKQLFGSEARGP